MDVREKGFTGFSTSPREEHRGTRAGHVLEGGKPFNLCSQLKGCGIVPAVADVCRCRSAWEGQSTERGDQADVAWASKPEPIFTPSDRGAVFTSTNPARLLAVLILALMRRWLQQNDFGYTNWTSMDCNPARSK